MAVPDYEALPQAVQDVHTYPILFGDSSQDEMQAIADADRRPASSTPQSIATCETIFKQIRGYQ